MRKYLQNIHITVGIYQQNALEAYEALKAIYTTTNNYQHKW